MFSSSDEKKFQEQLKLAQDGNAESQYFVGLAYEKGDGVGSSDFEAIKWYRMAANQGHKSAIYMLKIMELKSKVKYMKSRDHVAPSSLMPTTDNRTLTFISSAPHFSASPNFTTLSNFISPTSQEILSSTIHSSSQSNIELKNINSSSVTFEKRIIYFDIDDTLIDYSGSIEKNRWTSGSASLWQRFCMAIRILDKRHNIETVFGLVTYKDIPDRLALAVMGALPAELDNFILVEGVDEKGLSDFLDPGYFHFTKGQPKQGFMQQATKKHGIPNDAIWIIDDREEDVCKPARELGFTVFNSDVVCDNKDDELQKVKILINKLLTKANNDIPITLDELVPEETEDNKRDKRQKKNSENSSSLPLNKEDNLEPLPSEKPFITMRVETKGVQFAPRREPEKEQESNSNATSIVKSDIPSANNDHIETVIPSYQTPQFEAMTQQRGSFFEFYSRVQEGILASSRPSKRKKNP